MLNPSELVQSGGLLLIGIFLFAEVGLFLGFFLPGDTLLIAAGIYAHQGKLSVVNVIVVAIIAATLGDSLAYYTGHKLGPRVFNNKHNILFRPDHIAKAEVFYEKYGAKALLVTHFLPVIRTFTPLLAGVGKMPYKKFLFFNIIGDVLWAVSVTLVGYYIGSKIPNVDNYILLIIMLAIIFSVTPTLYHVALKPYARKRRMNGKHSQSTDTEKSESSDKD